MDCVWEPIVLKPGFGFLWNLRSFGAYPKIAQIHNLDTCEQSIHLYCIHHFNGWPNFDKLFARVPCGVIKSATMTLKRAPLRRSITMLNRVGRLFAHEVYNFDGSDPIYVVCSVVKTKRCNYPHDKIVKTRKTSELPQILKYSYFL